MSQKGVAKEAAGTRFRWHRFGGGIWKSMETVQPCSSLDELYRILREAERRRGYVGASLSPRDLSLERSAFDQRIGWNTYIVCVNGGAVGFTDGPLS